MFWHLLIRSTANLSDGRTAAVVSHVTTTVPANPAKPKPTLCMSLINRVRRSIAQEHGIPVSRVSLEWFDFVVGDESFEA